MNGKLFNLIAFLAFAVLMQAGAQTLFVGSYNVRYRNAADDGKGNGWERRCPVVCAQIDFMRPDIFGTQEALIDQLTDLQDGLPDYAHIGAGRDDGKHAGEHSAIFYRPERLRLLDGDDFWLSTTPERPSKGWDAALPRICSWGKFKEKGSGRVFFFFNLHFDHVGTTARRESAKLVLAKIEEIAGSAPVILTGDFNVDQRDEIYGILTAQGALKDSYACAGKRFAQTGTFNSFDPACHTDGRIDHIFVSPSISVESYGVMTDGYWTEEPASAPRRRTPSDHNPIFARLAF